MYDIIYFIYVYYLIIINFINKIKTDFFINYNVVIAYKIYNYYLALLTDGSIFYV